MDKKPNYGINFYAGADYGLDPNYGDFLGMSYRTPFSAIGQATDARMANQIKATSEKISTGGKVIEVQMTMPNVAEAIPNQHLDEIRRLKIITGTELTLHGPLVEPTGVNPQAGSWTEMQREQAERQMQIAVERGHILDPKGNIVITFHSSNGLPEPETKIIDEKTGKSVSTNMFVIDERTGKFGQIPKPTKDYLFGEEASVERELKRINNDQWTESLSNTNIGITRSREAQEHLSRVFRTEDGKSLLKDPGEIYALSKTQEGQKFFKDLKPEAKKVADMIIHDMGYSSIYVRDSFRRLQELYNQAYSAAKASNEQASLEKLGQFKNEVTPLLKEYKDDPKKIIELSDAISNGIQILDSIKEPPQFYKPLKEFAIDKSSETFSNIAFNAYKQFRGSTPIISIENPPAGMGLSKAEDLRELITSARKKFVEKAVNSGTLSQEEAKKQAEKLIGATWDLGHINMLRKYGYSEKDIVAQTKQLAPYVKHVHLSDNFGMEHTELPMGMGNVPTKKHMEIIDKYNKQVKKIIEAGDWFQHFQTPPFVETLSAFGSPLYPMTMGPYWNQIAGASGGYSTGMGQTLPDVHFQTYGAGFSNLPTELGGQMSGRNRLSGAPME